MEPCFCWPFLEYLVLLHPLRLFGVVIESLNDFVGEGSCMAEVLFFACLFLMEAAVAAIVLNRYPWMTSVTISTSSSTSKEQKSVIVYMAYGVVFPYTLWIDDISYACYFFALHLLVGNLNNICYDVSPRHVCPNIYCGNFCSSPSVSVCV